MNAKEVMATINRLVAKRDRQQASLTLTLQELLHWETELDKLKNAGKDTAKKESK